MSRVVAVVPLRAGKLEDARALIEGGPPFDLAATTLVRHDVYLTPSEAIFLFEGPAARADVERLVGDPAVWKAASAWRDCLAARPRLAEEAFSWARVGQTN